MQLTNDPKEAEVVIIYVLEVGRALLIDKRRSGDSGPLVEVLPQEDLLLEGKPVQAPLTPQVVHAIERRRVMPAQPHLMQSYFRQLIQALAGTLSGLRPALGLPRAVALAPHFAPVLLLASSELWKMLLRDFQARGEHEAEQQARERLRDLFALEILRPERLNPEQVEALRGDFREQALFRRYGQ